MTNMTNKSYKAELKTLAEKINLDQEQQAVIYDAYLHSPTKEKEDSLHDLMDIVTKIENTLKSWQTDDKVLSAFPNRRLAAYRYAWRGGKIAATPLDATSPDIESARDLLDETRRKAGELDDALANSNADPRVRRSVQNLVSVLPNRIEDLRPALFRSRLHSLEEDAAAFSAPADERELFPGAIAAINDVVSTGRDLQACYPQLREIEAERLALDLRPDQIPAALQHLKDVADAAERAPNIVERSAIESLKEIAALAAEDAGPLTTQKRTAEGLLVSQNFIDRLVWPLVANAFSREASDTLKEVSRQAKAALVKGAAEGLGAVGKPTVIIGIASVVSLIAGPTLGALAVLAGYGRVARVVDLARRFAKDIGNGKDGSAKE